MMRVAILDDYQQVALRMAPWQSLHPEVSIEAIPEPLSEETLVHRLHAHECIVAMRERTLFPRRLFERLPNLKLLVTAGTRNAAIDLAAASAHKVQVCGTNMLPTPTAELAWCLILALARHLPEEDRAMRAGRFQTTLGIGLKGKVLGLIGLGTLGAQVARVGLAFAMEVIAWSQNLTPERALAHGVTLVSKEELLARADFVSIHLVLSDRSRGLIGASDLARMKPSAYLVNTSRGPIVDEAALIECLKARRIAGAGLDVFDREPLPRDHALRQLDNTVITPHLGYVTEENYRLIYGQAVEDIRAFLEGKVLRPLNTLA
ncbi:MAG TPA: D-2-hydroxyacid dehydrogenase family protein [Stellaceae bacterium]|nr:D-2-hydroxyacid dehydrogenase family protein [Stellaceae bacterium]